MRVTCSELTGGQWQVAVDGVLEPFVLGAWSKGTAKRKARELQADIDSGRILPGFFTNPAGKLEEMVRVYHSTANYHDQANIIHKDHGHVGTVYRGCYDRTWSTRLARFRATNFMAAGVQDEDGFATADDALEGALAAIANYDSLQATITETIERFAIIGSRTFREGNQAMMEFSVNLPRYEWRGAVLS